MYLGTDEDVGMFFVYLEEVDQAEQRAALLFHGRNPIRSPQADEASQAHQKEPEAEAKMWSSSERLHITCQGILPCRTWDISGDWAVLAPADTRACTAFCWEVGSLWKGFQNQQNSCCHCSPLLFNVTRDLNTTELIFEGNRKYCNNRGCNVVTNESYCSPLHLEFLG